MPNILTQIAHLAGIADHDRSASRRSAAPTSFSIGTCPATNSKSKSTLESGKLDVLTIAPLFLPDEGIENFVRLASEKCPQIRVLVQEFWLPFDANVNFRNEKPPSPDRSVFDLKKLQDEHDKYFHDIDELVKTLNEKYQGKPAVFVVPVGQAVLTLRKKIAAGTAPGLTKQTDLFTDPIGHATSAAGGAGRLLLLRRDLWSQSGRPAGPSRFDRRRRRRDDRQAESLLQEIAWTTVTEHPLSGVKAK